MFSVPPLTVLFCTSSVDAVVPPSVPVASSPPDPLFVSVVLASTRLPPALARTRPAFVSTVPFVRTVSAVDWLPSITPAAWLSIANCPYPSCPEPWIRLFTFTSLPVPASASRT